MVDRSADLNGEDLAVALIERGVNPAIADGFVSRLGTETVSETIRWFDSPEQRARGVSAGVLVNELRAGGRKPQRARSVADEQHDYGDQLRDWLREHFPEWNKPDGNRTHTAALTALIHEHHRHGKHWGPPSREATARIRAAVKAFDEKWAPGEAAQSSSPDDTRPPSRVGPDSAAPPGRELEAIR